METGFLQDCDKQVMQVKGFPPFVSSGTIELYLNYLQEKWRFEEERASLPSTPYKGITLRGFVVVFVSLFFSLPTVSVVQILSSEWLSCLFNHSPRDLTV